MTLLNSLKQKGCLHDVSHFEQLEQALENSSVSFYCGFDPTAPSLHVGSMLPLLLMRRLQRAGHRPIVLLGSATGMIGDPSGKSEERKLLDQETILENVAGIEKQASLFLEAKGNNGFTIVRNDEWLGKIGYVEFLREIGKHFSVNSMIAKDSVKSRLENREQGISYTEFSYMLLQAFDFYWLYKNKNCSLQVGGSDQWGNITAGAELIRRKLHAENPQVYAMTFPLLLNSSGTKFGKTEQGTVWLDPERTSPYRFYQFWLNIEDADILRYLQLFTEIEEQTLAELQHSHKTEAEKRLAQKYLARELTTLIHGESETKRAITASDVLFGASLKDLDAKTLLEIFADVPATELPSKELINSPIVDLIVATKLADSKASAKRLLEGGGVYINNEKVDDYKLTIGEQHLIHGTAIILRSGKKKYHLIKVA
jgi:tyrosyl-tRNA synthetase